MFSIKHLVVDTFQKLAILKSMLSTHMIAAIVVLASLISIVLLSLHFNHQRRIKKLARRCNQNSAEFMQMVTRTLNAKDPYIADHSLRVTEYAVQIAQILNLTEVEIDLLKQACMLHDIGKIGIPDDILNKKDILTESEREHILRHPVVGRQILSTVSEFSAILDIIYSHHERVDGRGYPDGRTKEEIPLLARILAVADTYDAMRPERPYRRAKTKDEAIQELHKVKGSQLDEDIVDKFIDVLSI